MASPIKGNIALRYLESINETSNVTPNRPLQPTLKYNSRSYERRKNGLEDLDDLAKQLNVKTNTPSKTSSFLTKFESPSVTVSSFKSPTKNTSNKGTPLKATFDTPISKSRDYDLSLKYKTPSPSVKKNNASPSTHTGTDSPGYEYLCRIQAIKNWLEHLIQEPIEQKPAELLTYIRNGIYLAKLANLLLPQKRPVFLDDRKLQFRHTENINRFFKLLDFLKVPDLFRFELTDLYDAKDIPKVWYCLHAMSYMLNKIDSSYPQMENLVNKLEFSPEDIRLANRSLPSTGLPNFGSADTDSSTPFGGESSYMNRALATTGISTPQIKNKPSQHDTEDNPFVEKPKVNSVPFKHYLAEPKKTSPPESTPNRSNDFDHLHLNSPSKKTFTHIDKASVPQNEDYVRSVIMLQTLVRGANFRYKMFVDRILLKSMADEMTFFFSIIRGYMTRRRTIHRHRDDLMIFKSDIIELQSLARFKLLQRLINIDLDRFDGPMKSLQSIVRASLVRKHMSSIVADLERCVASISHLQSKIRGNSVRPKFVVLMEHKDDIEPNMTLLQSAIRRCILSRRIKYDIMNELVTCDGVVNLQSLIRAKQVQKRTRYILEVLSYAAEGIAELQSIARGGISRTALCNDVLITLLNEDFILSELYAKFRGNKVRNEVANKKDKLKSLEMTSIVPVQTIFRGVLNRFHKEILLDDLYMNIESIIQIQACIRGRRVRDSFSFIDRYYLANEDKVIRAQAMIKTLFAQRAYKSLINMKNPPLSVIQRFAYLLTDNDKDYEEEMELSALKNEIIDRARHNEELESQIENMDVKLSLLDKNKITVEEFVKHRNKLKPNSFTCASLNSTKTVEKLNKSARQRIEIYLSLFYFLQTKPSYLVRLYESIPLESKDDKFCKSLFQCITNLFPIRDVSVNKHSREEYFFVRFILSLMQSDIETNCHYLSDITKSQSCFWVEYFIHMNNNAQQRLLLKCLVGRLVINVIENEDLDFSSDPSVIYSNLIKKEIKINGSSTRPQEMDSLEAIKDPIVSEMFVDNLMSLRECATDFVSILEESVTKVPTHVKIIAQRAYQLSASNFPNKTRHQHLAVAGVVFVKHYISVILQYPENYGYFTNHIYTDRASEEKARENLKYLNRVLLQLFSMKPFNDNFLKPLNSYITSQIPIIEQLILKVVDVGSIEDEYEMNDYDDLTMHERPAVTMKASDMIMMEKIVDRNIDILAPSQDDQLVASVAKLNDLVGSANDYVVLTELGNLTLNLSPTSKEESLADSKTRTLMSQAKRCILYLIRVQDGSDLLELLISGIKPAHEEKFKEIISTEIKEVKKSEHNEKRRPYYKSSLGDLSTISYRELKKKALEIILQLEAMGELSRKTSFQQILNEIALDIKTKHSQRISRISQIEIASKTNTKLEKKEKFLKHQLDDYNKHVENILSELQLKPKDKKLFNIIPIFSKQYFYHRELRKANRLPKFGSYKYSAKKLMDQEILIDFGGAISKKTASSSKLDFMFSCHEIGNFTVEAASGSVNLPGAYNSISLDDLLNLQYEGKDQLEFFDGMAIFNTQNFCNFIFKKFYDLKKE